MSLHKIVSPEIVNKYDVNVPRYTSFPPVPNWKTPPKAQEWHQELQAALSQGVHLYLHIPFCRSLCAYCGCFRIDPGTVTTTSAHIVKDYLHTIHDEWELYQEKSGIKNEHLRGIHLGGGTPNTLTPEELSFLLSKFGDTSSKLLSIELNPHTTTPLFLETLAKLGVQKISFGIQDFDPTIRKIIGREGDYESISEIMNKARSLNFTSINIDLVLGLPGQTLSSIEYTLDRVASLRPDTIAYFSYAHVPWFAPLQKGLEQHHIPVGSEKLSLLLKLQERLFSQNYIHIGLDHYALPSDPIAKAFADHKVIRNFMGHTYTQAGTLLGLGASSISSSKNSYLQNEKDLFKYMNTISQGQLATIRGHQKSELDRCCEKIIQTLLCYHTFQGHEELRQDFSSYFKLASLEKLVTRLLEFRSDGLLEMEEITTTHNEQAAIEKILKLKLTYAGVIFIRNIASAFDYALIDSTHAASTFGRSL
ncbi:MAG: coproporphyrinogen dehydrogenase [Oligoflexia bacterium]|nr:coproporphyrinogen dehydrogenase [Oligoflexia bacterium]